MADEKLTLGELGDRPMETLASPEPDSRLGVVGRQLSALGVAAGMGMALMAASPAQGMEPRGGAHEGGSPEEDYAFVQPVAEPVHTEVTSPDLSEQERRAHLEAIYEEEGMEGLNGVWKELQAMQSQAGCDAGTDPAELDRQCERLLGALDSTYEVSAKALDRKRNGKEPGRRVAGFE